jgi:hypothetical protein
MTSAGRSAEPILKTLAGLYGPDVFRTLGERVGADEASTSRVVAATLPALLVALARNAATESGARSLLEAVVRHHDGAILDDVLGALRRTPCEAGDAAARSVLAAGRARVETRIARQVGIHPALVSRIVAALAPLVFAAVQRAQDMHRFEAAALARALGAESTLAEDTLPGCMGVFEELLDPDPELEMGDDVSEVGAELLRRLSRTSSVSDTRTC